MRSDISLKISRPDFHFVRESGVLDKQKNSWACFLVSTGLKRNLNASKPSEHPPERGELVKTFRLDGNIGCTRLNLFVGFYIPDTLSICGIWSLG